MAPVRRALIVVIVLLAACRREHMFEVSNVKVKVPDARGDCDNADMIRCPRPPHPPLESLPKVLHRVEPKLSEAAQKANLSGVVIVRIGIRRDGSVGGVCVLKPLPCGLNTAAVEAVKQWKFEPREDDAIADVPVHFLTESTAR
jgi:TonB family protein